MVGVATGRGPVTLYCYLSLGSFTYLLNIQGNVLPFLKDELLPGPVAAALLCLAIARALRRWTLVRAQQPAERPRPRYWMMPQAIRSPPPPLGAGVSS